MSKRFTPKLLAALIGIVFVVAGCGGSASSHNDADVAFARQMIPHHGQAVTMAALASGRAASGEVKALAKRIEAAQGPEIAKMRGWLKDWGEPQGPSTTMAMSHSDNMGGSGMGVGMMSEADMSKLTRASGSDFDRMFLSMMTEHHRGALAMAKVELAKGKDKDAKALAQSITDSQTREIADMRGLLNKV